MGRYQHRRAMRAGTQVLSPIQESPSTSPPPVSDADTGSQAVDHTGKGVAQSDVNSSLKSEDSPKSHRINVEKSFVDHLRGLNEDYRQQLEATREELRLERERNAKIVKDLEHYRVEYKNFKLSWTMDQAEINDLKARVQTLDTHQRQMNLMHNTITRLERENNKLKALSFDADGQLLVPEETKAAMTPKMPSPPDEGHPRRRPYTGKTRNEQTTSLPSIADKSLRSPSRQRPQRRREVTLQHICLPPQASALPHHQVPGKTPPAGDVAGSHLFCRQSMEHLPLTVSQSITRQNMRVDGCLEALLSVGDAMNKWIGRIRQDEQYVTISTIFPSKPFSFQHPHYHPDDPLALTPAVPWSSSLTRMFKYRAALPNL